VIIAIAWIVGVIAAAIAAALACADSAIMANWATAGSVAAQTAEAPRRADRERAHRAVAMARVLAYIVAGACFARPLASAFPSVRLRSVATIVLVLGVAWLTEGVGRALGYAHADVLLRRLHPGLVLSPEDRCGAKVIRANLFE